MSLGASVLWKVLREVSCGLRLKGEAPQMGGVDLRRATLPKEQHPQKHRNPQKGQLVNGGRGVQGKQVGPRSHKEQVWNQLDLSNSSSLIFFQIYF